MAINNELHSTFLNWSYKFLQFLIITILTQRASRLLCELCG